MVKSPLSQTCDNEKRLRKIQHIRKRKRHSPGTETMSVRGEN